MGTAFTQALEVAGGFGPSSVAPLLRLASCGTALSSLSSSSSTDMKNSSPPIFVAGPSSSSSTQPNCWLRAYQEPRSRRHGSTRTRRMVGSMRPMPWCSWIPTRWWLRTPWARGATRERPAAAGPHRGSAGRSLRTGAPTGQSSDERSGRAHFSTQDRWYPANDQPRKGASCAYRRDNSRAPCMAPPSPKRKSPVLA